jgi:hypothetical protein
METQTKTSFETFKTEVLSKRIGRKKVNLNEIKVISDCAIEYAGLTFALSDDGFKSLLRQTGISAKKREAIIRQYGADFADKLVSMLTRVLADSKSSIVMIIDMNKRKVLNFAKAEESMISNEVYLDEVEKVLNDSNLVIDSMLVKPNGGFEITTLGDKSQWGLRGAENNETFKFGLSFDNSPISGTRLLPFNKRLICTNGMIGLGFTQAHHLCNTQESWETFYRTITNLKKDNFLPYGFDERLKNVMSATASVNELLTASNIIRANANTTEAAFEGANNPNYLPVEHFVPTESTFRAYQRKGIDLDTLNKEQRKNAVSDVKYWDVINGLTDFASHNYGYGSIDSGNIQRFAGKMFVGTPDLSNLVPSPF